MFNNAGINKVFLVGHVGKTPRLHAQPDGQSFYCFPLATSELIKKNDQSLEHTEWHLIKIPASQFADVAPDLDKGHLIYLEGKIKTKAFTDEDGVKRYKSEIVSNVFRVLSANLVSVPVMHE
jgi:single-strand DNA-binding protein